MCERFVTPVVFGCVFVVLACASQGSSAPFYFSETGHYYDVVGHPGGITWFDADAASQSLRYLARKGHLATVTSQAENDFITANVMPKRPEKFYWLGGYQPPDADEPAGDWQWVTGETWDYTHWNPGEPNGVAEDWLEIYGPLVPETGYWNDLRWGWENWENDPYLVGAYIVEYEGPAFFPDNGHYYDVILHPEGIDWYAAAAEARSLSHAGLIGHLATITSAEENDFITANLMPWSPEKFYWLGGYQPEGSSEPAGGWQWVTGEPWSYSNWNPGEPNNARGDEDFLEVYGPLVPETSYWNDLAWHWYDEPYTVRAYVVEYDTIIPEPSMLVTFGGLFAIAFAGHLLKRRRQRRGRTICLHSRDRRCS